MRSHTYVGSFVPAATIIGDVVDASYALVCISCTTLVAPVCNTDKSQAVDTGTTIMNSPTALDVLVALDICVRLLTAHSSIRRPLQSGIFSPTKYDILGPIWRKTDNTKCFVVV